ncbi:unnamed protein product [Rotaria sordida]|uniref:Uncharacterized protein n=1 Tax=Rotaria sordida TaxID=392033 RepID=A0A815B9K2_9BILA|nr:unnamed protein product [Rotaria sordida]
MQNNSTIFIYLIQMINSLLKNTSLHFSLTISNYYAMYCITTMIKLLTYMKIYSVLKFDNIKMCYYFSHISYSSLAKFEYDKYDFSSLINIVYNIYMIQTYQQIPLHPT